MEENYCLAHALFPASQKGSQNHLLPYRAVCYHGYAKAGSINGCQSCINRNHHRHYSRHLIDDYKPLVYIQYHRHADGYHQREQFYDLFAQDE